MSVEQPVLRFGIMCGGETLQKFQLAAVRRLLERNVGAPVLLIVDDRKADWLHRSSRIQRIVNGKNQLWHLFAAVAEPELQRRVPLDPDLAALPRVRCRPHTRGSCSEYFSQSELAEIESYRLDFILRFAFGIIRGDILKAARYGVWSFHHGDESYFRGGPPAFWEIYKGSNITGAILQRLTDRLDSGIVLRRGWIKTISYSYSRNLNAVLRESIEWPAAAAFDILKNGSAHGATESATQARIYTRPTNLQMLLFGVRLAGNVARRLVNMQLREEWNVGMARLTAGDAVRGGTVSDIQWCPPLTGGWVADPIAVPHAGQTHVLCERMRLQSNMGYIAALPYSAGQWGEERVAIEAGCHASYPYVVHYDREIYCVPETYEAREVRLYRATEFPHRWERVGTLLSGTAVVDSTVFHHNGLWWLLCTSIEASGHRLQAYYAEDLFGPWHAHPNNPVKIDVRSSRPAGPPFFHGGVLYRPAQDCSNTYGGRIAIVEIKALSPVQFSEEIVSYLEPDPRHPYGKGLHTLSLVNGFAVVDGKRWRLKRPRAYVARLKRIFAPRVV